MAEPSAPASAVKVLTARHVRKLLELGSTDTPVEELRELHLEGLGADGLAPGALAGFAGLFKLFLQKNSLKDLPARVLDAEDDVADGQNNGEVEAAKATGAPHNLTFLDLSENMLPATALPRLVDWRINNLVTLKLAGNGLRSLPPELFKGLPKLCALVVNDNKLKALRFEHELPELNTIIVSGNRIDSLGPETGFDKLPGLKKLSASKNRLTALPAVGDNPLIAELRLANNKISTLSNVQLAAMDKLAVLDLGHNEIEDEVELRQLANSPALLNVSFLHNPVLESLKAGDDKEAYAKKVMEEFLPAALRLRILDGKPLKFFGVQPRQRQARPPSRAQRRARQLAAEAARKAGADGGSAGEAAQDSAPSRKRPRPSAAAEASSEPAVPQPPSKFELAQKELARKNAQKAAEEDVTENDARDGSGVEQVIVKRRKAAGDDGAAKASKKDKKAKKAKSGKKSKGLEVANKASWATSSKIDTW